MIGHRLLHYEITEKLGEGGMGVVYKARDTHLDRFVAVKVLPPEKVADAERKRRFVQEAKAASALNHPNIVTIHDIASEGGIDFIAMEYVTGKTLDQLIPRKGMRLSGALKIAVQIAGALARAHGAGIIHRDLKPANVILDDHGLVKVLDFGLAKLTEPTASSDDAPTRTLQAGTAEGVVVGTAAYMAPEQAEGRPADSRGDIFAFGAVLYEMLSGRRAFSGLRRDDPPPLEGIPPELARIVRRCLRPDQARRFQNMADLRVALEDLLEESESGVQADLPKKRRPPRLFWVAVFTAPLMVLAGVWFGYRFFRPDSAEQPPQPVPLTSLRGYEDQPSFAPDGAQLAFVWNGPAQDNSDIYVLLPGSDEPQRRTSDPAPDFSPAWSPDGRSIAFLRRVSGTRCVIILIPFIGGPERKLVEVEPPEPFGESWPPFLAWSADSRHLAAVDRLAADDPHALFSVSLESAEKRRITDPPPGTLGDTGPAISADGRRLAFSRMAAYPVSDLFFLEVGQDLAPRSGPQRLTSGVTRARNPAWAAGDRSLVFVAGHNFNPSLWRVEFSRPNAPGRLPVASGKMGTFAISVPNHRLAFSQNSGDSDIWAVDLARRPDEPGRRQPLIRSTANERYGQFSPDGRRIAFVSERTGTIELWVSDAEGGNSLRLTSFSNPDLWLWIPRWSPDSKRLVISVDAPESIRNYVIDTEGGALRPLPIRDGVASSWSADGRFIYFSPRRQAQPQVWKLPVAGGEPIQVTHGGGAYALESPDGKLVYFTKRWPGMSSLWSIPVGGGPEVQVEANVRSTDFEIRSNGVFFLRLDHYGPLLHLDPHTRKIKEVTLFPNRRTWSFSMSPDGRFILHGAIDPAHYGSDLMLVENFR